MRHTAVLVTIAGSCALISGCTTPQPKGPVQRAGDFSVIDGKTTDTPRIRMGHPTLVRRVIRNGRADNRVMDHLTTLTETYGPRLTGSTNCESSAAWAADQFRQWGLENVQLHHWGDIAVRFDRGPSSGTVYAIDDDGDASNLRDLEFTTLSWTRGTDGPARGRVVRMPETLAQATSMTDQLAGAWVLIPESHSSDQRGIRSVGYLMRERTALRHEIRNNGSAPLADSDAPPAGPHWAGTYLYSGNPIATWMQLSDLDAGDITGTLSIPGFSTGPVSDATYDADSGVLTFEWKHDMGASSITLTIAADSLTGESTSSSGNVYAIEMAYNDGADTPDNDESDAPAVDRDVLAAVLEAGPLGFISSSRDPDRVWTTRKNDWDTMPLADYEHDIEVNVRSVDYDYINSRVSDDAAIQVEFDLNHRLTAGPIACHNVIAEIPGTKWPEQVVIMSAHLDSWDGPGSKGTVDNATGVAVMMEAARLLMASNVKPERTVRFILWTGEEQGLLGSKAYADSLSGAQLENISAVFVDDGGTNYQGGAPAADFMAPFLAAATAPINGIFYDAEDDRRLHADDDPDNDLWAGYMNVNIRPTGGTIETHSGSDHAPFNARGVPGFFWDEVGRANYRHAWHTQNDTLDQAIPGYLRQSSTNSAVVAYQLANAPTRVPRSQAELDRVMGDAPEPKPAPDPRPQPVEDAPTGSGMTIETVS